MMWQISRRESLSIDLEDFVIYLETSKTEFFNEMVGLLFVKKYFN